jgi:hypothetical protein
VQPIHASKRLKPSSSAPSRIPSGTIDLHSIPKRTKHIPSEPAASSGKGKSALNPRISRSKSSKLAPVVFESSSDEDAGEGAGRVTDSAEQLFAGASWLSGDAAPSSFSTAATSSGDTAGAADDANSALDGDRDAAAAVCSDDDTSGDGDIVLDGGLRVRFSRLHSFLAFVQFKCSQFFVHFKCNQVPRLLWCSLLPFQRTGLRWLWGLHCRGHGGILADEMGLGKTVQACALIASLMYNLASPPMAARQSNWRVCNRYSGRAGAFLVVCPATLTWQWARELAKWVPPLKRIVIDAASSIKDIERLYKICRMGTPCAVIVTY